jgi:hypothetical protein
MISWVKPSSNGIAIAAEQFGESFGIAQAEDQHEPFIGHRREGSGVARGLMGFDLRIRATP